eukprot:2718762-Rhodomonas_salina.1
MADGVHLVRDAKHTRDTRAGDVVAYAAVAGAFVFMAHQLATQNRMTKKQTPKIQDVLRDGNCLYHAVVAAASNVDMLPKLY